MPTGPASRPPRLAGPSRPTHRAAGAVSVAATLPATASGQVALSAGITGTAPRAQCLVTVTPSVACADADADGACDSVDTDDDNDGVPDGSDAAPFNGNACGDGDGDLCDDCVIASTPSPGNDGPDADNDGLCDFGDRDFDNDGALDWADGAPLDPTVKAVPVEVAGFALGSGGNKNRLTWTAPRAQGGSATVSDVLRGTRAGIPVGSGAETCAASGTAAAQFDDPTSPPAGTAFWYLVRVVRNACGSGGYGTTGDGAARTSAVCPSGGRSEPESRPG